ncbi:hypothetical protein BEP19_00845 [Ammoniphilus oxalaticus]|uniref:Prepilin-type N-terminal cleavage/methylation domain-containing protein n=1 Tax=Ammoniphilus oxalaticus TaxID=66863 RepID=A0A419SML1_9BACL|nr:prepilin-type N-terminal cleavage/methylation domain-containing protein [Ammoniphilus oxalaticus]RKD25525.1 hypothetical protein BEP19_00845 [Ammoniphilus oxalaticus]
MGRSDHNHNGYSLLELAVALAIFSTLLLISVPHIHHAVKRYQTAQFLEQLTNDLSLVAAEARAKKGAAYLSVVPNSRSYYISFNGVRRPMVFAPNGMTFTSNFNDDRLWFRIDGQVSQGGTFKLLERNGRGYHIVVQLSSGCFDVRSATQ